MKSHVSNLNFRIFNLKKELLKVIYEIGYNSPTSIQCKCIPELLKGKDVLAIAKTGSGKTAAFVLPILNNINSNYKLQSLVLSPTRELVIQITNFFNVFSKYLNNTKIVSLYGGQSYCIQFRNLRTQPHIIVATPGRLIDHINRKTIDISNIKILIIDEADEMLHMGFINDVKFIINKILVTHQTALFSATMPNEIKQITKSIMKAPIKEIILNKDNNVNIIQYFCYINYKNKLDTLFKFLESEKYLRLIIFVKTKDFSLKLSSLIEKKGYNCSALNGDMNQNLREKIVYNFRNGYIHILIATDIASRGLDINNVNLIINYDIPYDINSYIHRIGRTGRADNIGKAILLVDYKKDNFFLFKLKKVFSNIKKISIPKINKLIIIRIEKLFSILSRYFIKNNFINKFYKNFFLNKILNFSKKNLLEVSVASLMYIYEKNFTKLSYKDIFEINKQLKKFK